MRTRLHTCLSHGQTTRPQAAFRQSTVALYRKSLLLPRRQVRCFEPKKLQERRAGWSVSRRAGCLIAAAYRRSFQETPRAPDARASGRTTDRGVSQYAPQYQRQRSQRQLPPPPARQLRRRLPKPQFKPPPPDEPTLSCQQVVSKQVITRTSGVSLGFIRHLCTDPDTLSVVSAELRPKNVSWGISGRENLLLETFCQIGDVVLVHDEGALDFVPQDETLGFIDLIGCPVMNSSGSQLGKVREYSFSPETGRVDLIKFDPLGWPAVPEKLIGTWQIGVESVETLDGNRIYLLPQAEAQMTRISDGPLEAALLALQGLALDDSADEYADGRLGKDVEYENWKRLYGRAFSDAFGQAPPMSRSELDNFYAGMQAARESPSTPKSLPPGQQVPIAAALRPDTRASQRVEVGQLRQQPREPVRVRRAQQPESRRQMADTAQQPRRQVASVPILAQPSPSSARSSRDVDGRYGDQEAAAQPSSKRFDDWVTASEYPARSPMLQGSAQQLRQGYRDSASAPRSTYWETEAQGADPNRPERQQRAAPASEWSVQSKEQRQPVKDRQSAELQRFPPAPERQSSNASSQNEPPHRGDEAGFSQPGESSDYSQERRNAAQSEDAYRQIYGQPSAQVDGSDRSDVSEPLSGSSESLITAMEERPGDVPALQRERDAMWRNNGTTESSRRTASYNWKGELRPSQKETETLGQQP